MFASIDRALQDLQAGKMIIVIDDQNRENEGDLVIAAEKVTPEIINFMATGKGLICVPAEQSILDRLTFMRWFYRIQISIAQLLLYLWIMKRPPRGFLPMNAV